MTVTTIAPMPQGTLEHLDPTTLVIETNVRTDVALDDVFLNSLRTQGVITPILAYRDTEGAVQVRAGQRRTRGAREVALATVPVYVVDAPAAVAERIIDQLAENEHREALTEADRIEAWKQLSFEGMSVTQIAKRTGVKRDRVKAGVAVAKAETGIELVQQGLTLDQVAVLLEFEDDCELVASLTRVGIEKPGMFPHAVENARRERAEEAEVARLTEEATAAGFAVLEERPEESTEMVPLSWLHTESGERVGVEELNGKEGVSVYIARYYGGPRVSYYITNHAQHGWTIPEYILTSMNGGSNKGPMTDEQKAERKQLIANNKAWDAAETVRREWLTSLFTRKTLPKNAGAVVAELLTTNARRVSESLGRGSSLAVSLLGLADKPGRLTGYLEKNPGKHQHVTVAITLAGIEDTTDRWTWRSPDDSTALYLRRLADWGYTLSPVEQIAAKLTDTDTDPDTEPETAPAAATEHTLAA